MVPLLLPLALFALQSPVLTSEMWPGEGIPHFVANTTTLDLYAEPSRATQRHRLFANVGAGLEFDDTRFITIRPGHVVARKRGAMSGRVFGGISYLSKTLYDSNALPTTQIAYVPGDTLEYLQNRAEGTCIIRAREDVVEVDNCPAGDHEAFTTLEEPQTEWWIHVNLSKTMQGWLLVDPKAVRELSRTF